MIDREKLNKVLDSVDKLRDPNEATITIQHESEITVSVYPKDWWMKGAHWTDEERHHNLSALTPLVGKMAKVVNNTNIGYLGEKDGLVVKLNYIDQCKVVGYKTVKKTIQREIERPVEYETEEIEEQVMITDCDIRSGRFTQNDIEVKA